MCSINEYSIAVMCLFSYVYIIVIFGNFDTINANDQFAESIFGSISAGILADYSH